MQRRDEKPRNQDIIKESRESKERATWRERASFKWECHTRRRIKEIAFSMFYSLCVRVYLGVHEVWAYRECF